MLMKAVVMMCIQLLSQLKPYPILVLVLNRKEALFAREETSPWMLQRVVRLTFIINGNILTARSGLIPDFIRKPLIQALSWLQLITGYMFILMSVAARMFILPQLLLRCWMI